MASYLLSEEIRDNLVSSFNELLDYVQSNSALYKEKFQAIDYRIKSLDDLLKIPMTERSELQKYYPFGHLCKNRKELGAYFETSGSTGNPIPVLSDVGKIKTEAFAQFIDYWMGLLKSKIDLAIVALPYEMNPMGLKYHNALIELGITVIPTSVRTTICHPEKLIRLIHDLKPSLLVGRPMEIMRYAEGMKLLGLEPSDCSVRKIFLTGETMTKAKWNKINQLYGGIEIYSTYGLTELDVGLTSCCANHYHLPNSPNIILEILNSQQKLASEGEIGEIVITSLDKNFAPLIRYRTQDVGIYHINCECNERDTPYVEIVGREMDAKTVDGKIIYPRDIEEIVLSHKDIGCEYQIIYNNGKLILQVEKAFGVSKSETSLEAELLDELNSSLSINPEIRVFEFNELADKFGIAKSKGCRFFDISNINDPDIEKALKINICDGDDFL